MLMGIYILKAPIDVQADVLGSVLIQISVVLVPTHLHFHFSCFKSWHWADMASPLSDTDNVYLMNAKRNLTTLT